MTKSKHTQVKQLSPVQDSATRILGSYTLSLPCATQMVQPLILSCTLVSENLLEQNPPQTHLHLMPSGYPCSSFGCPSLTSLVKAVLIPLLSICVSPGNRHHIPGSRIVICHVKSGAPSFGPLYLLPSIHGILDIRVESGRSGPSFRRFPERPEKTVILLDIFLSGN